MTTKEVHLWGRRLDLEIEFEQYSNEEVLASQNDALNRLLAAWDTVEGSLGRLKEYCLSNMGENAEASVDNIFRVVAPTTLYVLRDETPRVVSLLCECRFDPEHGVALRFEDERLEDIGSQDIAL